MSWKGREKNGRESLEREKMMMMIIVSSDINKYLFSRWFVVSVKQDTRNSWKREKKTRHKKLVEEREENKRQETRGREKRGNREKRVTCNHGLEWSESCMLVEPLFSHYYREGRARKK